MLRSFISSLFRPFVAASLMLAIAGVVSIPAIAGPPPAAHELNPAKDRAAKAIGEEISTLSGMSKTFQVERIWLTPISHGDGYRWQARVKCVVTGYETPRTLLSLAAGRYDPRSGRTTITRLPAIP